MSLFQGCLTYSVPIRDIVTLSKRNSHAHTEVRFIITGSLVFQGYLLRYLVRGCMDEEFGKDLHYYYATFGPKVGQLSL